MGRDSGFIPTRSSELTAAWCTEAMHDAGVLPRSVQVESVKVVPLGGGTGLAGETVRLQFGYTNEAELGPEVPRTAVAKFANEQPVIKGLLESIDAYGREISFYQTLSRDMPMRVPKFLGGGMDPGRSERATSIGNRVVNGLPAAVQLAMTVDPTKLLRPSKRRYALMIEDLGDELTVHNVVDPPSPDALRLPLAELAKLHAAFWGRDDLAQNGATGRLITHTPRLYQNVYDRRVRALMDEVWSDWFTDEHRALVDEANRRLADDVVTINRGVTLVHGDPRSDNLLFDEKAETVTFVDWSLPAYAHPAYDVAYLLSAGLLVEDGNRVRDLGEFYLSELAARGRTIERAEFWSVARASVRAMLAQQVQAIPHPLSGYGDKNLEDYWVPRMLSTLQNAPR